MNEWRTAFDKETNEFTTTFHGEKSEIYVGYVHVCCSSSVRYPIYILEIW